MSAASAHFSNYIIKSKAKQRGPGNHPVVDVDNGTDGRGGGDDDVDDNIDADVPLGSAGAHTHPNWCSCRQFARRKNARNVRRAHFQTKMRAGHIFKWS